MKKENLLTCSLIALMALTHTARVEAASMDYNALQELFSEPVTTAATGTPQKSSEVATNMTIITKEEIRQAGTRDLPRIIGNKVQGIDVLQTSRGGFEVGVRGYQRENQPRLLVLIDGRQVFVDDYSRTVWDRSPSILTTFAKSKSSRGPAPHSSAQTQPVVSSTSSPQTRSMII